VHLILHVAVPLVIALALFGKAWAKPFVLMMLGLLIDVDHLLAIPIYDASRCSIGFHPLHQPLPILAYAGLMFFKKTRLVGLGLAIHILLDSIDCKMSNDVWWV
jgi:hypothetical protein